MNKLKISTKTGDNGQTSLANGSRVNKDHDLIEVLGTIDELQASLFLITNAHCPEKIKTLMNHIQKDLCDLSQDVAHPKKTIISDKHIHELEKVMESCEKDLPSCKEFIREIETSTQVQINFARTVCRRLERRIVTLSDLKKISSEILKYINRLSDLLFLLGL